MATHTDTQVSSQHQLYSFSHHRCCTATAIIAVVLLLPPLLLYNYSRHRCCTATAILLPLYAGASPGALTPRHPPPNTVRNTEFLLIHPSMFDHSSSGVGRSMMHGVHPVSSGASIFRPGTLITHLQEGL